MFVPFLNLAALLAPVFAPVHPHYPMAIPTAMTGGKVTITHITVPYDAEQVASLPKGGSWHMGFAALRTDVSLRIGGKTLPPGRWKFNVRRNDKGEFSTAEILHLDYYRATGRRGTAEKAAAVKAKLEKEGLPAMISVPFPKRVVPEEQRKEHQDLEFSVLSHGHRTAGRRGPEPAGGVRCTVFVSFGDMHHSFGFEEVWSPKQGGGDKGRDGGDRGK